MRLTRFKFNAESLSYEMRRLASIFLPGFSIPSLEIEVRGKTYSKSALTLCGRNKIIMYKPYHDRHPDDYKSTLLHELGHIVADYGHDERFKRYFNLLKCNQKEIAEKIIPDSYTDFLFARVTRHFTHKYCCQNPECGGEKLYRKEIMVYCSACDCVLPMLPAEWFNGVRAIIPPTRVRSLDDSIKGLGVLSPLEALC